MRVNVCACVYKNIYIYILSTATNSNIFVRKRRLARERRKRYASKYGTSTTRFVGTNVSRTGKNVQVVFGVDGFDKSVTY